MNDMHTEDRRASDNTQDDIRSLIMDMPDQKDKAILLILLRMAANLERNTELTRDVSAKVESQSDLFNGHENNEKILLSKAIGAWWVFSGVLVVGMALASMWFKGIADDYRTLGVTVAEHTIRLTSQRKDIDLLQELNRIQDGVQKGAR